MTISTEYATPVMYCFPVKIIKKGFRPFFQRRRLPCVCKLQFIIPWVNWIHRLRRKAPKVSEILLVVPPFLSVVRPNLGISAIKAACQRAELDANVLYLNLDFAALVGVDEYEWISEWSDVRLLLGEWIFGTSSSEDQRLREEEYIHFLAEKLSSRQRQILQSMRESAVDFVTVSAKKILADGAK